MSVDEKIVTGIKKGDTSAFQQLYEMFYNRLFLYAVSYVNNSETASDIVQELFLHLWQKHATIEIKSSVSSYLFRAIHNRSIQHLRHKQVSDKFNELQSLRLKEAELVYHFESDFIHPSVEFEEIHSIILATWESLPEKTKKIFALSRQENLKNTEISERLSIDIKTVEYHMKKALKLFRDALSDYI